MPIDVHANSEKGVGDPPRRAAPIVASVADELAEITIGIHVNTTGQIEVVFADDPNADDVTISVEAGLYYPYRLRQLKVGVGVIGLYP